MAQQVTQMGVSVNAANKHGITATHIAAREGHDKAVGWLGDTGANLQARDKILGSTPMHFAAWHGHPGVVECLASRGADVNPQNRDGDTPLHDAATFGRYFAVAALVKHGANLATNNKKGETPRDLAKDKKAFDDAVAEGRARRPAPKAAAAPHAAAGADGGEIDVREQKWFKAWVGQVNTCISTCVRYNASDIVVIGIQADVGKNPATENEWPALQLIVQRGFREGRVKGSWDMLSFSLIPMRRLETVLKDAKDNTFVLVASCPNQHFAAVTEAAGSNRNVMLCWGEAGDLANMI